VLKRADPDPFGDDGPSIRDTVGQLLDDGRAYAEAEIDLAKLRAQVEVARYKKAAMFGGIAAAFGLAALVAFAMTLVIGFARLLGPFGGGAVAVLVLALAAFGFVKLAQGAIEKHPENGNDDERG
jgi:hypothetical protein